MMFCTVLPSAATMPMASTNSGNAMMVSAMRPTMRSVQPPKYPAAMPASPPIRNTSATEATAMKVSRPRRHDDAAEDVASQLVGAEPVRGRRRLQRRHGVGGQGIMGNDVGTEQRRK